MEDVRRICGMCGRDQTGNRRSPGLCELRSSRGRCIALVCHACWPLGKRMVDELARMHGAYIVSGRYLCSPRNTPDVKSVAELQEAIANG